MQLDKDYLAKFISLITLLDPHLAEIKILKGHHHRLLSCNFLTNNTMTPAVNILQANNLTQLLVAETFRWYRDLQWPSNPHLGEETTLSQLQELVVMVNRLSRQQAIMILR